MKSFFKASLIVGAILLVLGTVMSVTALAMGAGKKLAWNITIDSWEDGKLSLEEIYEDVTSLDFDIDFSMLSVHEGETFSIEAYDADSSFVSKVENGVWRIRERHENYGFRIFKNRRQSRIKITLPKDFIADKADIELGAGQVVIDALQAKNCDLDVSVGELRVKNLSAEQLSLNCDVGRAVLAGRIEKKGEIKCDLGEIKLTLEGEEKDYSYDLDVELGHAKIGKNQYTGISNQRIRNENADKSLSIDCGVGSVNVEFVAAE